MSSTIDHYAADPDRDSRALVEAFFDHIDLTLADRHLDPAARTELIVRARELAARLEAEAGPLPDAAARYNRRYTAAVLAAYRTLEDAGVDDPIPMLTAAFVEPFAEAVAGYTRQMLDASPDPFAAMAATAKARETEDFGAEFEFVHSADDDTRYFTDVRRCGYHEYFRAQGAPELTPVFCAFDASWIGAIDPGRHGFTFTRDTTIGRGGPICPFHFERMGDA